MRTIKHYTATDCPKCVQNSRLLRLRDIEIQTLNVRESQNAANAVRELGYAGLPVTAVYQDGELIAHWHDIRPDLIAEHTRPRTAQDKETQSA